MEKRRILNEKILEHYIHKVKTQYPEDVALLVCYGSHVNGTMNRLSDVDCYFVPETERGNECAMTYILDGVGYDLFPMSWERLEHIADLKESLCPLVGDAVILYAKDGAARERFREIQKRMQQHLADGAYLTEVVRERVTLAKELAFRLTQVKKPKDVRRVGGWMLMTLAEAVLFHHSTYSHYGLKQQYEDLLRTPGIPRAIGSMYRRATEKFTPTELVGTLLGLHLAVCDHVGLPAKFTPVKEEIPREIRPDPAYLATLYEEISSTFNKIEICAETGNTVLAFLTGVCLQQELDDARDAGGPELNLLDKFVPTSLESFLRSARRIEKKFVTHIEQMGGKIRRYRSFNEFLAENGQPVAPPSSASDKSRTDH